MASAYKFKDMALAYSVDVVRHTATLCRYTLKAEQEQAIQLQVKQCDFGYSILHSLHCHITDNIVQELTTIMQ